jgi:hypothetical protein
MRWTRRERTAGEVAAVAVLVVGWLVGLSPAESAARVSPGMTPAEVEETLGTPGRPDYMQESNLHGPRDLSDLWAPTALERERALRKAESWLYRDYEVGPCVVSVSFSGPEGDERVTAVDAYRTLRPGWHLVPWLAGAVAAGFLATEITRRRRLSLLPPVEATGAVAGRL